MLRSVIALILVSFLGGCVTSNSPNVYTSSQSQRASTVYEGTVLSAREVQIKEQQGAIGTVAGAAIGGIAAGRNIGGGSGRYVSGILGAIAGGLIGNAIEKGVTSKKAYELTIKVSSSGKTISVVQESDVAFAAGQPVYIISDGTTTRVTPR
jgi:outer membrane lipoprotein SlyB